MPPIRPRDFDYQFSPRTLVEVRTKLGLSQAKLADILDVPVNTISRWETGSTTPDARALAAIYSVAMENGLTPEFFSRRTNLVQAKEKRTRLVLIWDFQNLSFNADEAVEEWNYMSKYLNLRFPRTTSNRLLTVYTSPFLHSAAGQALSQAKFQVNEGLFDADSQIIADSRKECAENPQKTVYVLVTNDGDFITVIRELSKLGVDVYLWADEDKCNEKLRNAVGEEHFIAWDEPFVVSQCVQAIKGLKGQPITRGEFGNRCRQVLDEYEIYPQDIGCSRRNPYASLLSRLEQYGIAQVAPVSEKPDHISIKVGSRSWSVRHPKQPHIPDSKSASA